MTKEQSNLTLYDLTLYDLRQITEDELIALWLLIDEMKGENQQPPIELDLKALNLSNPTLSLVLREIKEKHQSIKSTHHLYREFALAQQLGFIKRIGPKKNIFYVTKAGRDFLLAIARKDSRSS